jgi:replicative superfamily II helicase
MFNCMKVEYEAKKAKKDKDNKAPPLDMKVYYEQVQSIADAIFYMKQQYTHHFPGVNVGDLLPMQDAFALQKRFKEGSVYGTKFELLWYFQNGAHLLAGSPFAQKHRTTVFKPFKIQELMVDSVMQPGPQLVFGIAPPGTGKTAVVAHVLNLFPAHSLVFCCPALPVVLSIGKISNSLGLPYAFCKGRRITPSYSCGRGLGTHVDMPQEPGKEAQTAVESLRYAVVKLNLERKAKRLAEKKRKRNLHDLKRFPKMFLMCDTASCAWLLRQLDPNRTILVVDEPPMGSDRYPEKPEENFLAAAMMQTMMTPMYKTILMSATLPRPSALPVLVNSFLDRFKLDHSKKELHVRECFSTELDRGAVMCGPNGTVGFPHQKCQTASELKKLCERLPTDPLVLKAYTERALAALIQKWQAVTEEGKMREGFLKRVVTPEVKFADLSELSHASIRAYAMELLTCVADENDDEFTKAFCAPTEGDKALFPVFSLEEMLFSNAWAFPGLTLVSGDQPMELMLDMSTKLREQFPKLSELEADLKKQEEAMAKAARYDERKKDEEQGAPGSDEFSTKLKFSPKLVIQSEEFLKEWCKSKPENTHHIQRILPTVAEFIKIKDLPIDERWQMLALSGAGSYDTKLDSDPSNPVYTQWVLEAMNAHKLACVTAGKEFTWGANVPASTVVVTKSFAETTSVAGMLQYVGRAARRGLTTHGQAIFERNEDMERIFASPDGLSTEALTMERYAQWWLSRGKVW